MPGPLRIRFAALAIALLALAQRADGQLVYAGEWGGFGTGPTQFKYPTGIALSPSSGDVYVSDGGNNRVTRFTPEGEFVQYIALSGSTPGRVLAPDHLAFSPANGDLYVTDKNNNRVQRFTPDGAFVLQWGQQGPGPGQFLAPWGIGIDAAGDVYITSRDQERVQKFTEAGVYLGEFGFPGTGPGQFRKPHDVLVDTEGNVYVSDVERHDIQKFDATWSYVLQWGSPGSVPGQFLHPHHLAFLDGGVIVVDWLEHPHGGRLTSFTVDGALTGVVVEGPQGTAPLQFHTIYAFDRDAQGTWYVIEWGNHRVQKLRSPAVAVDEPERRSFGSMKAGFRRGR